MPKFDEDKFIQAVKDSNNKTSVCRALGLKPGGGSFRKVGALIEEYDLDTSHFTSRGELQRRYPLITKSCPVCDEEFEASLGSPKEKKTCSYSCSNTLFRSGKDNGQYKEPGTHAPGERLYRGICLDQHSHACILCGWDISIDVHHIDGNHENNEVENLVPLCANHHRMAHMNDHKEYIDEQVAALLY